MKTKNRSTTRSDQGPKRPYAMLDLRSLVALIAPGSIPVALRELLEERRPCSYRGRRLRLDQHIATLAEGELARRCAGRNQYIIDRAIDLTTDKFSHFPQLPGPGSAAGGHAAAKSACAGPDARHYYRALLREMDEVLAAAPDANELDRELVEEQILQTFITRHFYLSIREYRRQLNPFWSRYTYHANGAALLVWLPVDVGRADRHTWLETKVGPIDPSAPGERERVQEQIDRWAARRRLLSLDAAGPGPCARSRLLPWPVEYGLSVQGLAETVARKKVASIHRQRPSIRALGQATLHAMILRIFGDLVNETYMPTKLAACFGIDKATFSRWAGTRWREQNNIVVPDLWRNTARVLASSPLFLQAAEAAGVWRRVLEIGGT